MVTFFIEILHLVAADMDLFNLVAGMIGLVSGSAVEEVAQLEVIHCAAFARLNELYILYGKRNAIDQKLSVSAYFTDIQYQRTPFAPKLTIHYRLNGVNLSRTNCTGIEAAFR
jgi:hypothetical protein